MTNETAISAAAAVVAGYVSHHDTPWAEVPKMLTELIEHLSGEKPPRPTPPVPIEESYTDDYIVCLEDGNRVTLLKRYLRTHFDMSVEDYFEKWGLPPDYPIVTKSYSEKRSQIAKDQGLGKS